ncbi:MAG: ATP-dependent sacrificial sulfur transferase LarE [Oscillospiraceae bacterium]|nr:ATP-dependent sacrificial sulfur transferase LarE [Oscillospiraceae bacterium]
MDITTFFRQHPHIAIALSGGVDSAYLLYLASRHAKTVHAYYVDTEFQPAFEREDAEKIAAFCSVPLTVLPLSQLCCPEIQRNDARRCYHCKRRILSAIQAAAIQDGFHLLADGSNADDREDDRPGFQALQELHVCSPLRQAGLTKVMIRQGAREAGLFTHDKPAYACLATRIQEGEPLTAEKLSVTEEAEAYLHSLGFRDLRIRQSNGTARIQIPSSQFPLFEAHREAILSKLRCLYPQILPHPEVRT